MAQKRMFSLQIVDTDAFLDMPQSSQLLYFHLAMRADDEGFVSSPKRIMKTLGSSDDDLKVLIVKKFIINFKSGVCVIKHWLIHNTIRMDRFGGTAYVKEKAQLFIKGNKAYKLIDLEGENGVATIGQPNGNHPAPLVKLSKDNIKIELPLWLDKKIWEEWGEHRRQIKKKLTELTIKKQLKFLAVHQRDHIKIIENSISNGWTGLFPLKDGSKNTVKENPTRVIVIDGKKHKQEFIQGAGWREI